MGTRETQVAHVSQTIDPPSQGPPNIDGWTFVDGTSALNFQSNHGPDLFAGLLTAVQPTSAPSALSDTRFDYGLFQGSGSGGGGLAWGTSIPKQPR